MPADVIKADAMKVDVRAAVRRWIGRRVGGRRIGAMHRPQRRVDHGRTRPTGRSARASFALAFCPAVTLNLTALGLKPR
jgi:hypothetical protein